jgi:hypothetical protein
MAKSIVTRVAELHEKDPAASDLLLNLYRAETSAEVNQALDKYQPVASTAA